MSDDITKETVSPEGEETGRVRLIARQEVKSEVNGFFTTAEKFYKRAKLLITVLVTLAGGIIAFDHWLGSLAKKSELDELGMKVAAMGEQMQEVAAALNGIRDELKKKPSKPIRFGD